MLDWPPGRIGPVQCTVISPDVQIESKETMPERVPGCPRRPKDAEDIARLRQALRSPLSAAVPAKRCGPR
jgi:hypothetical protein